MDRYLIEAFDHHQGLEWFEVDVNFNCAMEPQFSFLEVLVLNTTPYGPV